MSGKRKKDDSEAVGIMKFFRSTERNTLSSKEPSDIAERSSTSSDSLFKLLTGKIETNVESLKLFAY